MSTGAEARFRVVAIDPGVAEAAIRSRRGRRSRLPDGFIWAVATVRSRWLDPQHR